VKASPNFLGPHAVRGYGKREDEGLEMFGGLACYSVPISLPLSLSLFSFYLTMTRLQSLLTSDNQITFTFNKCSNQACGAATVLTKSNLASSKQGIA
jgi:hypothetical protein